VENAGFSFLLILCTKLGGSRLGLSRKQAVLNGEVDMTAAPLWLIQNVRLADRDGLWQIAIDKGRFGEITPMGRRATKATKC
jgi:cytosine deaminase